jgi:hypothetical protein
MKNESKTTSQAKNRIPIWMKFSKTATNPESSAMEARIG